MFPGHFFSPILCSELGSALGRSPSPNVPALHGAEEKQPVRALGQKSVCCRLTPTSQCRQTEAGHGCLTHALLLLPVLPVLLGCWNGEHCVRPAGAWGVPALLQEETFAEERVSTNAFVGNGVGAEFFFGIPKSVPPAMGGFGGVWSGATAAGGGGSWCCAGVLQPHCPEEQHDLFHWSWEISPPHRGAQS